MNRKKPCKSTGVPTVTIQSDHKFPSFSSSPTNSLPHSQVQTDSVSLIQTSSLQVSKYFCQKCKTEFKNSKAIALHRGRCNGTSPYECKKCGLRFISTSNRIRHEKTISCQERQVVEAKEVAPQLVVSASTPSGNGNSIVTNSNNTMNHSNNVTTNNNNTVNITINAIGKENVRHLEDEISPDMQKFILNCIRSGTSGVCQMLVRKHFDDKYPENQNIRKTNKKDDFMEFHDGSSWQIDLCKNVLQTIFPPLERTFFSVTNNLLESEQPRHVMIKQWLDTFMKNVCEPLDWDLTSTCYDYEFDETMTPEQKDVLRSRLFDLAKEYIYRSTRTLKST